MNDFEWHKYKIKYINPKTKRKNTIRLMAKDKIEAEAMLEEKEIPEPWEFEEEFFDEPTKAQFDYATSLGIKIPDDANKNDVSCLIDIAVKKDIPASKNLMKYAYNKNVYFSKYTGRKSLYSRLFHSFNDFEKAEFFCFAVYQVLNGYDDDNFEFCTYRDKFKKFAELNSDNIIFKDGLSEYEYEDLTDFNIEVHSKNYSYNYDLENSNFSSSGYREEVRIEKNFDNIAFQMAENFLWNEGIIVNKNNSTNQNTSNSNKKIGCLPVIAIFMILAFIFS